MKVEILSPDKLIFAGEVDSIQVPGKDGSLGILNNHAPLVASLKAGKVVLRTGGSEESFDLNGGVVEVNRNKVIILSD